MDLHVFPFPIPPPLLTDLNLSELWFPKNMLTFSVDEYLH